MSKAFCAHPRLEPVLKQFQQIPLLGAHALLISGAPFIGKTTLARELARMMLCANSGEDHCRCQSCRSFTAGLHPDYIQIQNSSITVDEIRQLKQALGLSTLSATGRCVVILKAHTMTTEASNALLKSIEEPVSQTRYILTTDNLHRVLPTIRSRVNHIYLPPVPPSIIGRWMTDVLHYPHDPLRVTQSMGRPGLLQRLMDSGSIQRQALEAIDQIEALQQLEPDIALEYLRQWQNDRQARIFESGDVRAADVRWLQKIEQMIAAIQRHQSFNSILSYARSA
ncbi:AAA family ATPase [Candidatus Uhrbacteria bacterium]|nr:AAA family ATPase [Candidatus Uhrbacteria bacterium]